jgi:hypothetical protein
MACPICARVFPARAGYILSALLASMPVQSAERDVRACIPPWQTQFGGPQDDAILAMARDDDGNVYLAGYEGTAGADAGHMQAGSSGFVQKRSRDGEVTWTARFDTPGADSVDAIALHDHGVVVAGTTTGAFPGHANRGGRDAFVARLDHAGNLAALVQVGDERPQQVGAVARLPDDSIIVSGYDDIHIVDRVVIDWENGFVARFVDGAGGLRVAWWQRSVSSASDINAGAAVATDGSGDFFVTASSGRSAGSVAGTSVKRMRADGETVWSRPVSPIALDILQKVVVDGDRLYAGGMTVGSIAGPGLGGSDALVLALDPVDGSLQWSRQLGSMHGDWLADIALDAGGELHVAGTSWVRNDDDPADDREDVFGISLDVTTGRSIASFRFHAPALASNPRAIVPAGCGGRALVSGPGSADQSGSGGTDAIVRSVVLEQVDRLFEDGFGMLALPTHPDRSQRIANIPHEGRSRPHGHSGYR